MQCTSDVEWLVLHVSFALENLNQPTINVVLMPHVLNVFAYETINKSLLSGYQIDSLELSMANDPHIKINQEFKRKVQIFT